MNRSDRFELPLTTDSEKAAQLYCDGVDQLLAFQAVALETLDKAIAEDEQFALAHIARARALQVRAQVADAKQAAASARALTANITERERQHIEVLALLVESRPAKAMALLLKHVDQWPKDALPISIALGAIGLFAFSGRTDSRNHEREFLASIKHHWSEHWWFDTYYGWVLVETGAHTEGNALLDRALAAKSNNAQAVHARAHGHYECGDIPAGQIFLETHIPQLDADSLLMPHLRWHQALMALQSGDMTNARKIYAEAIAPDVSRAAPLLLMMDAASFAWRCHVYGQPLTDAQLKQVQEQAKTCLPKAGPSFFNWHKAMALASAHDEPGLATLSKEVDELIEAGRQPPGEVMKWICQAMSAAAAQRWDKAQTHLEQAQKNVRAIGGSNAQQDAITDALVAASLTNKHAGHAADLIQERSAARAMHLGQDWAKRITPH
ncbi:MAG: hypothetical protein AB8C46_25020 [Burkholderiaceae bacterium]